MNLKPLFAGVAAALFLLAPMPAASAETTSAVTDTTAANIETTTTQTTAKSTKATTTTTTAKSTKATTTTTTAKSTKATTTTTTAKSTKATTTTTTAKSTKATTTTTTAKSTKATTTTTTAKSTKATTTTTTAKSTKATTTTTTTTETTAEETTTIATVLSGLWQDEDGNTYYYIDGEARTGFFSVVPEYLAGDVEGDGIADAVDASLILNAAAGEGAEGVGAAELLVNAVPDKSEEEVFRYADIGNDGRIDAQDAAEILNYSALIGADANPLPLGFAAYFADANGVLQTGWITDADGALHYAKEDFQLCFGWMRLEGRSYYFDGDGRMLTGWQELEDGTHYFNEDGSAAQGFQTFEDMTICFSMDGLLYTGWQKIGGETYYFDEDGAMQTGITQIGDTLYRFNENGVYKPLKICLDAGHYAKYNRSPVVPAYWESEMSWKLHLYLKAELESYGIEVMTTRPKQEEDLAIVERGELSEGCDMFLSLHSDAIGNSATDRPTAYCTVTGVLNPLGVLLADTVHEVMGTVQAGEIRNRVGDNGDYYGVLRGAASVGVPGILIEHSYHTNARSAKWLLSEDNLKTLAAAEAKVISDYFLSQE